MFNWVAFTWYQLYLHNCTFKLYFPFVYPLSLILFVFFVLFCFLCSCSFVCLFFYFRKYNLFINWRLFQDTESLINAVSKDVKSR